MILSIDFDFYSGTREFVFDAPIWGVKNIQNSIFEWKDRFNKRNLEQFNSDFPLYDGYLDLLQFKNIETYYISSHEQIIDFLYLSKTKEIINLDSHHDLSYKDSLNKRLRAGNWVKYAFDYCNLKKYSCFYPNWHKNLAVAEGFDINRTQEELKQLFNCEKYNYTLDLFTNFQGLFNNKKLSCIFLVHSKPWVNPFHDKYLFDLCKKLQAIGLEDFEDRSNCL